MTLAAMSYVWRKSRKSRQAKRSGVAKTPSGTRSPLRSAIRRTRSGGAVPSRWTWSSALGTIAREGGLRRAQALEDRGRVGRRLVADRERRPQRRDRGVGVGVGAGVHDRERRVGRPDPLAGRGDLAQPDGVV